MSHRVLIVDDDQWIRQMVGTALSKAGHTIDTATNGAEGLEKAASFKPDIILTDVVMDVMDGWSFVRALRGRQQTSFTPVIFLTGLNKEEDRIRGFKLGADDYLPKPFRLEELSLRVDRCLRSLDRMKKEANDLTAHQNKNVSFKGDLGQLGVSSLLTLFEMEQKTGVLVLRRQPSAGRLFMRQGKVLAAFLDGEGGTRGEEAVYEMLRWGSGSFEFMALEVDMEDQINASTTHLLMEGARLMDETDSRVTHH